MGDMTGPDLAKVLYSWAMLEWHPEPELLADVKASFVAAAAGGGLQQQEQPGSSTGLGLGMGFKSEAVGFDLKPEVKIEGIKLDPGFKADPDLKLVSRRVWAAVVWYEERRKGER
jgi:hypothetical protein